MFLTENPLLDFLVPNLAILVVVIAWKVGRATGRRFGRRQGYEEGRDAGYLESGWALRHVIGVERFRALAMELQERPAGNRFETVPPPPTSRDTPRTG